MKKKIVLTGGGTAGHITPHLALMPYLKKDFDFTYIGSKNSMEQKMMQDLMPFYCVETTKLKRKLSLSNMLIPFKLIKGICQAKKLLKKIKPNIIFSKGGFVAVPVVIAGHLLKIPIITHESDYTLGLANKLIKNKCTYVCTSFDVTSKNLKNGIFTGSPIREQIFKGNKQNIYKKFNFDKNKKSILFIGGSLGSQSINSTVFGTLKILTQKYNVLHIVGKNNVNDSIKYNNYVQIEFANNVEDAFDFADVVVTRGGANVLFELLAIKKPMLIIPLSKKESRGDQILNANYFKQKGYANVLPEENLTAKTLLNEIENTFNNADKFKTNMKNEATNGTKKIVDLIKKNAKWNLHFFKFDKFYWFFQLKHCFLRFFLVILKVLINI